MPSSNIVRVVDKHVRRLGSDYAVALAALLPTGIAWPRNRESILMQTVRGLANVWGFVDSRAADLLERESDPRATLELLEDWERAYGLPDLCIDEPQGITARREALLRRITTIGAQSRQFFIDLAADLGYTVTITEYSPFQIGVSHVGYTKGYNLDTPSRYRWYLGPPEMRFFWTVDVGKIALFYFHCAAGQCGIDPLLRNGRATDLECVIRRAKPAHTIALFDYSHQRIEIIPGAAEAQLLLTTTAPTRVLATDPKVFLPPTRDLIVSTFAPIRSAQKTIFSATGNVVLSSTAPTVVVGAPTTLRAPATRDLATSTFAPTLSGAWTPVTLGTALRGWYRADGGARNMSNLPPADTESIFSWLDESGNSAHLFRTSSPTFSATGMNGRPAINFDVNDALRTDAATPFVLGTTTTMSIFAVATMTTSTEFDGGLVSYTATGQANDYDNAQSITFGQENTNGRIRAYRNNRELSVVDVTVDTPPMRIGTIVSNNGQNFTYLNNVAATSRPTSTAALGSSGVLTVGSAYQSGAPNRYWRALIAEVVITSSALSATERDSLINISVTSTDSEQE